MRPRTQLFNIFDLKWDEEICGLFGIDPATWRRCAIRTQSLDGQISKGLLPHPIPIHGVLGDSHGSLFGQGLPETGN